MSSGLIAPETAAAADDLFVGSWGLYEVGNPGSGSDPAGPINALISSLLYTSLIAMTMLDKSVDRRSRERYAR